jgi:hypothetical protein
MRILPPVPVIAREVQEDFIYRKLINIFRRLEYINADHRLYWNECEINYHISSLEIFFASNVFVN